MTIVKILGHKSNNERLESRLDADTLAWSVNQNNKDLANELVTAEEFILKNDVRWTPLKYGIDRDSTVNKGILTRKDSRGVVDTVIAFMKDSENPKTGNGEINAMSVVTGTPGIGKSRMLLHLARKLLRDGRNVLYFDLKSRAAHFFIMNKDKTCDGAWSTTMTSLMANSCLFTEADVHVLVDPSDRDSEFAYPTKAHLVLAASTNSARHYAGFKKHIGTSVFYLGAWTVGEMKAAAPHLLDNKKEVTALEISERFRVVGGTLRYIFSQTMYTRRLNEIEMKATTLTLTAMKGALAALAGSGSEVEEGDGRLPGAFFTYSNKPDSNDGKIDYTVRKVLFLSNHCTSKAANVIRKEIFDALPGQHPTGITYEDVVSSDLVSGFKGDRYSIFDAQNSKKRTVSKAPTFACESGEAVYGIDSGDSFIKLKSLLDEWQGSEVPNRRVLVPCDLFPLIDFADNRGYLFQSTVAASHSFILSGVVKVLKAAGRVTWNGDRKVYEEASNNSDKKKLHYVKIVPYTKQSNWMVKAKDPLKLGVADLEYKEKTLLYHKNNHDAQKELICRIWLENVIHSTVRSPQKTVVLLNM